MYNTIFFVRCKVNFYSFFFFFSSRRRHTRYWRDWSSTCALPIFGMRFLEVHGPVPRVHEAGVVQRAEQFLMRLQPGEEYRRTNWTMTVDRRLDTSTETYPEWGRNRRLVVDDPALPDLLHLRVAVQPLLRLVVSKGVCFLI